MDLVWTDVAVVVYLAPLSTVVAIPSMLVRLLLHKILDHLCDIHSLSYCYYDGRFVDRYVMARTCLYLDCHVPIWVVMSWVVFDWHIPHSFDSKCVIPLVPQFSNHNWFLSLRLNEWPKSLPSMWMDMSRMCIMIVVIVVG